MRRFRRAHGVETSAWAGAGILGVAAARGARHTDGMKLRHLALGATVLLALAACTPAPAPVVAPVVVDVGDLQGATVEVPINSMLVINTGSLDVDSYTAEVADSSIAEWVQGREDASASFNPGFTPKKVGDTEVTLTNSNGGIQNVEFTLEVTQAP